jgi:hypothetical protein
LDSVDDLLNLGLGCSEEFDVSTAYSVLVLQQRASSRFVVYEEHKSVACWSTVRAIHEHNALVHDSRIAVGAEEGTLKRGED